MTRRLRGIALALTGAMIASIAVAVPVFAASPAPSPASPAAPSAPGAWEAVAGNFATQDAASTYLADLAGHGFTGFTVETEQRDGRTWYQVERPADTVAAARAAVAQLRAAGRRAWIELDAAHWEAVAGNFLDPRNARVWRSWLAGHGFRGFTVEVEHRDGKTLYQVARPYATRAGAATEVARLHARHLQGWAEYDAADPA